MRDTKKSRNTVVCLHRREMGISTFKEERKLKCLAEECNATSCFRSRNFDLPGSPRSTFLISFNPDRSLMASTHGDHTIRIICSKTLKCIRTLEGHPRTPWCLAFHPSCNDLLASGCLGGQVRVWDLRSGGCEVYCPPDKTVIASLAFHPEDQLLLVGTNNKLLFWKWDMPEPFATIETASSEEKVRLVRFDCLGQHILTGITNAQRTEEPVATHHTQGSSSSTDNRVMQTYSWTRLDPDFIADYVARSRQTNAEFTGSIAPGENDTPEQTDHPISAEHSESTQNDNYAPLTTDSSYFNLITDQQRSVLAADLSSGSGLPNDNTNTGVLSMLQGNDDDYNPSPSSNQPAISTLLSIVNSFDEPRPSGSSASNTGSQAQVSSTVEELPPSEVSSLSSDGLVTSLLSGQSEVGAGVVGGSSRHSTSVATLSGFRPGTAIATATARTLRHVHTAVVVAENASGRPQMALRAAINRAIAGAFAGNGEGAVASNIINTTHRLQWWDFSQAQLPQLKDSKACVLVRSCKIHNDASCDISKDGTLLAAFLPSPRGFPDDGMLAIFSLESKSLGHLLFRKKFGPNAISVSISPLNHYVMVGLASRRVPWQLGSRQLVAQIYKLQQTCVSKPAVRDLYKPIHSVMHELDPGQRSHVSVNAAFFHPQIGGGLVYGTNRGHLRAFYVGAKPKFDVGSVNV